MVDSVMTEAELQILEDLYMTRWPIKDRRSNSYMKKCIALYQLAQQAVVPNTCFVELGAWHGAGSISLAMGSRAGRGFPVYAVDTFIHRTGWAGEKYYPQDKKRFLDCVKYAGVDVTLAQMDVGEACKQWTRPISLLVWDLGTENRLATDFNAWKHHVVQAGVFAVVEGGGSKGKKPRLFGSKRLMNKATKRGWTLGPQFPESHLYTIVKS